MIGPMIGSSSRTPAITREQDRETPEHGVDGQAQDLEADERRDADDESQEDLAAEPLPEHADAESRTTARDVRPPFRRQRRLPRPASAPAGP